MQSGGFSIEGEGPNFGYLLALHLALCNRYHVPFFLGRLMAIGFLFIEELPSDASHSIILNPWSTELLVQCLVPRTYCQESFNDHLISSRAVLCYALEANGAGDWMWGSVF